MIIQVLPRQYAINLVYWLIRGEKTQKIRGEQMEYNMNEDISGEIFRSMTPKERHKAILQMVKQSMNKCEINLEGEGLCENLAGSHGHCEFHGSDCDDCKEVVA